MRRLLLTLLCGVTLAACGNRELQVTAAAAPVEITQAADPTPMQMSPMNLRLITTENLNAFLAEIQAAQGHSQYVFVAMQMRDYENLMLNLAEIRRYVEQQQSVILFYRRMTAPSN
jgi:hypothetical protein